MRAFLGRCGAVAVLCSGAASMLMFAGAGTASASSSATLFGHIVHLTPAGKPKPSGLAPQTSAPLTQYWTPITNAPPAGFTPGSMELGTNGVLYVYQDNTGQWATLTPDKKGSYVDGTWGSMASMPSGYEPEYTGSEILPNGDLLEEGGEYNAGPEAFTSLGALYNPVVNQWTTILPPGGVSTTAGIGDSASFMTRTGRFILAPALDNAGDPLEGFNFKGRDWSSVAAPGKADRYDEEGLTMLQNGKVLAVDIENDWSGTYGQNCSPCTSELFTPSGNNYNSGSWAATGNVPVALPNYVNQQASSGASEEMGPQVLTQSGKVVAIGGQDNTAVYNPANGTWKAGPQFPSNYDAADAPGAAMNDGNVLATVSPGVFNSPTHFYIYNTTSNTVTQVADPANSSIANASSYEVRLIMLPTGQIAMTDGQGDMEFFQAMPTGSSSWEPTISSLSATTLGRRGVYTLSGSQLSGLSAGGYYGDDIQQYTNYPLVRITNNRTGDVSYARTSGFGYSMQRGATSSTKFQIPTSTELGKSTLQVVADGIASAPTTVTITTTEAGGAAKRS